MKFSVMKVLAVSLMFSSFGTSTQTSSSSVATAAQNSTRYQSNIRTLDAGTSAVFASSKVIVCFDKTN